MDKLYNKLNELYSKELINLNIGNQFNKNNIKQMLHIINAIDFITNNKITSNDYYKIISYYAK